MKQNNEGEDGVFVFDNINSLEGLFLFFNHKWILSSPGYIWRGHRKKSWVLRPTLDRKLTNVDEGRYNKAATGILNRFKFANRQSNPLQQKRTETEWWTLGQHHGLLTPLLDWTISPYVALFFCFSESKSDDEEHRCLFLLHRSEIDKKAREIGKDNVNFFHPYHSDNKRLINQAGLLSMFPQATNIESWVRDNFAGSDLMILVKIYLPNELRIPALQALNRMNINYNTLFPDIDGAAKHVNLSAEIPHYTPLWDTDG